MRNFKGFIFTVDAIFALVVAATAVSVLLLANYTATFAYQEPASEAFSIAQLLSQTTAGQSSIGIPVLGYAASAFNASQSTWPQFGGNSSLSMAASAAGPGVPTVLFGYAAANGNLIDPAPVVADGLVVFTTNGSSGAGAGSSLYAINATNGALVFNVFAPANSQFVGSPAVYSRDIFTFNSAGYVNAYSEKGSWLWSASTSTTNAVVGIMNGYVDANGLLFNYANGSSVSTTAIGTTAYAAGEYIVFYPTSSSASTLAAYTQTGTTMTNTWSVTPAITQTPVPKQSVWGNVIAVGGGNTLYAYTTGGVQIWSKALTGNLVSVAAYNDTVYAMTTNSVYGFSASNGTKLFGTIAPTSRTNVSMAVTKSIMYTLSNGSVFSGFSTISGRKLWSLRLQGGGTVGYVGGIALAYGNAYVAVGNSIYAIGTCKADPKGSILQFIAAQYLAGQGECGSIVLNATYPSNNIAIYVNSSYAPALRVADFNGKNGYAFAANTSVLENLGNQITLSAWVYPTSNTAGYWGVFDKLSSGSAQEYGIGFERRQYECPAGAPGNSLSGALDIGAPTSGLLVSCSNANVPIDKWTYFAMTFNGAVLDLYINGTLDRSGSAPGSIVPTTSNIEIGDSQFGAPGYFNGSIADVQVYNSTLSANQVRALYVQGMAAPPIIRANVIGWWPLDGDTNEYVYYQDAVPYNVNYAKLNFTPVSLRNSYEVSRASVPLSINVSGAPKQYNIGVVLWR